MYPLAIFVVHILSKAQVTLKKMEHMKNTVDMAKFFMLSQMVVRSFYFVVLEASFPTKTNHTTRTGMTWGLFLCSIMIKVKQGIIKAYPKANASPAPTSVVEASTAPL